MILNDIVAKLKTIGAIIGKALPLPVLTLAVLTAILGVAPMAYFSQKVENSLDRVNTQLYLLNYEKNLPEEATPSATPSASPSPSPEGKVRPRPVSTISPATSSGEER